jgi:hypothetical protein
MMKNAHKSLTVNSVGAVRCAAFGVYLLESMLSSQRIAITPFTKMDQTTPNGP